MLISIFLSKNIRAYAFKVGLFSTFVISILASNAFLIANDNVYITFNVLIIIIIIIKLYL